MRIKNKSFTILPSGFGKSVRKHSGASPPNNRKSQAFDWSTLNVIDASSSSQSIIRMFCMDSFLKMFYLTCQVISRGNYLKKNVCRWNYVPTNLKLCLCNRFMSFLSLSSKLRAVFVSAAARRLFSVGTFVCFCFFLILKLARIALFVPWLWTPPKIIQKATSVANKVMGLLWGPVHLGADRTDTGTLLPLSSHNSPGNVPKLAAQF